MVINLRLEYILFLINGLVRVVSTSDGDHRLEMTSEFREFLQRVTPLTAQLHAALQKNFDIFRHASLSGGDADQRTQISFAAVDNVVEEVKALVSGVDKEYFLHDVELPMSSQALHRIMQPLYYSGLTASDHFETSIFGFRDALAVIPLHNHPQMYGFLRVLTGRVLISSFSFLDPSVEWRMVEEKRRRLHENADNDTMPSTVSASFRSTDLDYYDGEQGDWLRPVRFEGAVQLSANSSTFNVAALGPLAGNVHTIESLEAGSAFFDLLVPGYTSPTRRCAYYALDGESSKMLHVTVGSRRFAHLRSGDLCWIREISEPSSFRMESLRHYR